MINLKCVTCNAEFEVKPYRATTAKCCSLKCIGKYQSKFRVGKRHPMWGRKLTAEHKLKLSITHKGENHPNYGKHLPLETRMKISKSHTGKKLSEEAKEKIRLAHLGKPAYWNKGARSNMWKGGITPLNLAIRKCYKYRQWRSDVFVRDDFICQTCGEKGGRLNADHIKPYSIILCENKIKTIKEALECGELWNIDNGRTLCEDCHQKTDSFGGSSKITNKLLWKKA